MNLPYLPPSFRQKRERLRVMKRYPEYKESDDDLGVAI